MRKIKFRYVYQNADTNEIKIVIKDITQIEKDNEPYFDKWVLISRDEFTGLKDKNGKEIYEGDIMGRLFDDYNENTIILYHKGILCAKPTSKDKFRPLNTFSNCGWVRVDEGYNYNFEIIGNIHDNPSLLTNKE